MLKLFTLLVAAAAIASPALANDTMAEVKTGGLIFAQSDDVSMAEEDLFISSSEVRVAYVFENTSDKDVESLVAFPMPDIAGQVDNNSAISDYDSDNFLHFSTVQDGKPITANLQQRVISLGIDVTDEFAKRGIPFLPFSQKTHDALAKLPENVRKDWIARGLVYPMAEGDANGAAKVDLVPLWTLRSTYWWRTVFPAGKKVSVEHRYKPAVGGTVAISFLENGEPKGERFEEYSRKYCLDGVLSGSPSSVPGKPRRVAPTIPKAGSPMCSRPAPTGRADQALPADDRQGQARQPHQLLRQQRREDRPDDLPDDRRGFQSREGFRHPDPQSAGSRAEGARGAIIPGFAAAAHKFKQI
jgi:hypothetical protein